MEVNAQIIKKVALYTAIFLLVLTLVPYDRSCNFSILCQRGVNPTTYFGWPLVIFRQSSLGVMHFDIINVVINYMLYFFFVFPGYLVGKMLWERYR